MGSSSIDTSIIVPGKYGLDGSKIYDTATGETVLDLSSLDLELLEELYRKLQLEKKNPLPRVRNKNLNKHSSKF